MTTPSGSECFLNNDCITGFCKHGICDYPGLNDPCNPGFCTAAYSECLSGFCKPSCPSDEYFDDGICYLRKFKGESCTYSRECRERNTCLMGKCVENCSIDSHCEQGERCISGVCQTNWRSVSPIKNSTPKPRQQTDTYNGRSRSSGSGVTVCIVAGSLFLFAILILVIWGCYRCCCKSTKTKGKLVSSEPIVVQQDPPPAYPSIQSPYMPSSPQSYTTSSQTPPQYYTQPPTYHHEKINGQ